MASTPIEYNPTARKQLIQKILNSDLHGRKIYLLGSAEYGPVNEPILVSTTVGAHNKFGSKGTLIDAFHQVKYTNHNNEVYLVKITGDHSRAYLNMNIEDGEVIKDALILSSSQANEIFNDVRIIVDITSMRFIFPEALKINDIEYKYSNYRDISHFVDAINEDTRNGKNFIYAYHNIEPSTSVQNAFYAVNPIEVYFHGGFSGLHYSKNALYVCLERAYKMLESHDIDIVVPVDAFIDDIYPDDSEAPMLYNMAYYKKNKDYLTPDTQGNQRSYLNQLINFCITQMNFGMITTGVMGFNSSYKYWSRYLYESDDLTSFFKNALKYNLSLCDNPWYAFMISIVGGDVCYDGHLFIDNGYLAYAALSSDTIITEGTTNKPISDTLRIWNEFGEDHLKDLADAGIVTFRHSPLYNTPVIYDGITGSFKDSNLKLYANVRMIQLAISYLNDLYQSYIGCNMNYLMKKNIIHNDTREILETLKSRNILKDYDFAIKPYYSTGEIKVYLNLRTLYMIKSIKLCGIINTNYVQE